MILFEELTERIIKAAYQVHNELGCGFMEGFVEGIALRLEILTKIISIIFN